MARILQVSQLGNEVLRRPAQEIKDIKNSNIQNLIEDMIATVADANAVGLAAPQVYESIRLMIVWSRPNARYPKAPAMEPLAVINPEITYYSEELETSWEGCLSTPGIRALVPRHKSIKVSFYNRAGEHISAEYGDFVARIFQHEYDHLEGVMFLDRVTSSKDIMMEKEWQKLMSSN